MIALAAGTTDITQIYRSMRDRLPMWTIYRNPVDYPDKYVARMFVTLPKGTPTNLVIVADSLDAVRAELPAGLVCIKRDEDDPLQIVETWI